MDLHERYLQHSLIAQILHVASQLDHDKNYSKEEAVKDLTRIVDEQVGGINKRK